MDIFVDVDGVFPCDHVLKRRTCLSLHVVDCEQSKNNDAPTPYLGVFLDSLVLGEYHIQRAIMRGMRTTRTTIFAENQGNG